jgi:hypothetical protein
MKLAAAATILLVAGGGLNGPPGGRCAAGFELLHNPFIDHATRKAAAASLREAGCLGRAPRLPQRRRLRRQSDDEPPA